MKGRIALVQFHSVADDKTNMERMEGFIKRERGRSDLIVFPELAIRKTLSGSGERELLRRFAALAKENRMDIVPGSVLVKSGGKSHNRSYYIGRDGKVLSRYDKSSLWKSEKGIVGGNGPEAFRTRFGRTALIICWDLASPEVASKLAKLDLDIIICPSMWWEGEVSGFGANFTGEMIDSLCLARCYESRSVMAYANAAGKMRIGGLEVMSAGRSQISMPFAGAVASAAGRGESVVRYELNNRRARLAKSYFA